jgi:A/G-specific adenine glycosylase
VAHAQGRPEAYPVKTRKLKRSRRQHALLWLQQGERVWLQQRPATGVWAGLWSLPEADTAQQWEDRIAAGPGVAERVPAFVHVLTHVDWTLEPVIWRLPEGAAAPDLPGQWFRREDALQLGLPAPIRKLISR